MLRFQFSYVVLQVLLYSSFLELSPCFFYVVSVPSFSLFMFSVFRVSFSVPPSTSSFSVSLCITYLLECFSMKVNHFHSTENSGLTLKLPR